MGQSGNFYIISFIVMFSIIIGLSLIIVVRQWWKNKHSLLIVTQSTISDKRIEEHYIRSKRSEGLGYRTRKVLIYYITFDLEGGEHIELRVSKLEYAELEKGSSGKLTFQGTKYIGFESTYLGSINAPKYVEDLLEEEENS